MYTRILCLLLMLGFAGIPLSAQPPAPLHLNGYQDGTYPKGEYLVDSTVIVQPGMTMIISAGSILRFKRYGTFRVEGRLLCPGLSTSPIVFTSHNDRMPIGNVLPTPFDWNGIVVEKDGAILLQHVRISCATFGLKALCPRDSLTLDSVRITKSGVQAFSLGDSVVSMTDGQPFSLFPLHLLNASNKTVPPITHQAPPPWRRPVQIASLSTTLLGIAGAAVGYTLAASLDKKYQAQEGTAITVTKLGRQRDAAVTLGNIGVVLGGLGISVFSLSFLF